MGEVLMEIIKIIDTDGTCKLEITSNDYNRDKQTIEKICEAARDILTGNTDRLKIANETITNLLWQSTQRCANAMQKIKSLQETIEFDNMQIAHYDDELKQAIELLKSIIAENTSVCDALVLKARITSFINNAQGGIINDDNSETPTDNA